MIEFGILGAIVAGSWGLSLSRRHGLAVIVATLLFFSKTTPLSLLFLLTLYVLGFIQSLVGARKIGSALTQKRYWITLFGLFCAIFGAAWGEGSAGNLLVFLGLLVSMPLGLSTVFFHRNDERLTLSSFMVSVVIPALCSVEILLKIRPQMKGDYSQLWDITLATLGVFTFLYSSMMAFVRPRLKASLMHLSQAGIGLCLLILSIEQEQVGKIALAALSVFVVSAVMQLSLGAQMGRRYLVFSKLTYLGLPGFVSFAALFFTIKMTIALNILWLLVLLLGYFFQFSALIGYRDLTPTSSDRALRIRFWLITLVQASSGIGLLWMGGLK